MSRVYFWSLRPVSIVLASWLRHRWNDIAAADGKGDEKFFQDIGGVRVDLRNVVNDIQFMVEAER